MTTRDHLRPLFARVALPALLLALVAGPGRASEALDGLMKPYDTIHAALAGDSLEDVTVSAKTFAEQARELAGDLEAAEAGVDAAELPKVREHLRSAAEAADALAKAETIEAARAAFGPLAEGLVAWRTLAGSGPAVAFCPMAGKRWLETDAAELDNPYYGSSMLRCGTFEVK